MLNCIFWWNVKRINKRENKLKIWFFISFLFSNYFWLQTEKAFRQLSHLRNHIETHAEEHAYACEVCGRTFKTRVKTKPVFHFKKYNFKYFLHILLGDYAKSCTTNAYGTARIWMWPVQTWILSKKSIRGKRKLNAFFSYPLWLKLKRLNIFLATSANAFQNSKKSG